MKVYKRKYQKEILRLCSYFPVITIVGPRQVGKTTLAKLVSKQIDKEADYLDLELESDISKLENAELYFNRNSGKCIIIDEVQLRTNLFPLIRAIVDKTGDNCQFIITGSASPELLRQSTESLAGRIAYVEIQPFSVDELPKNITIEQHWFRGGFPMALFAPNDSIASEWVENFVKAYVERDLRMLGLPAEPLLLRRFWTMLAYMHGNIISYSTIANSLGITVNTVKKYIDFFEHAYLVKRLFPYYSNVQKRLIKSPKILISDTGIMHYLLGIINVSVLYGNPALGNSWEGYCIMQILSVVKNRFNVSFYRTKDGAECDLVLKKGKVAELAIEIKYSSNPKLTKGNTEAFKVINAKKNYVIIPEGDAYPLRDNVDAIGLREFIVMMQKYIANN